MVIPKKKVPRAVDRNVIKRRIRDALTPIRMSAPPVSITVRIRAATARTPFSAYVSLSKEVQRAIVRLTGQDMVR